MGFTRRGVAGVALVSLALALALVLLSCGPADPRGERADALLDDAIADEEGPGCSAAVARDGVVIWTYARGLADIQRQMPIDTATRFNIGSVSKQFTATAALMLVEDGALALGDAVSDRVEGLPLWAEEVTLAELMTHTSGIIDMEAPGDTDGVTDVHDRMEALTTLGLAHVDTTGFRYANDNYVLLGLAVESATGDSLAEWMKEHIFGPYGLDMVVDPGAVADGVAVGYEGSSAPGEPASNSYSVTGPTGIIASPSELAEWGDHYREPVALPAAALQAALDDAVPDDSAGAGWRYGPGVSVSEEGLITHGGFDAGTSTHFAVSPDRRMTLATSCNGHLEDPRGLIDGLHQVWFTGEGETAE